MHNTSYTSYMMVVPFGDCFILKRKRKKLEGFVVDSFSRTETVSVNNPDVHDPVWGVAGRTCDETLFNLI